MTDADERESRDYATVQLAAVGVVLTEAERRSIEVTDFGLGRVRELGLELLVLCEHGPLLREGARPLARPYLPRAPSPAVRGDAGRG